MKEKYEQLHILLLIAWLVTRNTEGYFIIFPFLGVMGLVAHIIVTQVFYQRYEQHNKTGGKPKYMWLQVFHYLTLAFIYICIVTHFIWRLINAI